MKAEIETTFLRSSQSNIRPAPSLRVPVTADNREFLRWLRAAEMSAWESGLAGERLQSKPNVRQACAT